MSTTIYESGSLVTTTAAFVNTAGVATDPTTVTLKYKKDATATVTAVYPAPPIIKDSVGSYHADLDTSGWVGPGLQHWFAEWAGTGLVTGVQHDDWLVRPPLLL